MSEHIEDVKKSLEAVKPAIGDALSGSTPAPVPLTLDIMQQHLSIACDRLPIFTDESGKADACANAPEQTLSTCETQKLTSNCYDIVVEGVRKYCKEYSSDRACKWLDGVTTTTATTGSTGSTDSNNLPLIIGGVVGVIALLVIGIGLFCYCRNKKKASAPGQSMTGTTGGGSTTRSISGRTTGTGTTATNTTVKY